MDAKQKADYLKNPNICPHCGSDSLDADWDDIDGNTVTSNVICNHCEAEWTDIYTLTDVRL